MSAPKAWMLSLPTEIFDMVSALVSKEDLKNLSLTCKATRPSAQRLLFNTLILRVNLTSFGNLGSISRDPILSSYVRRIEFYGRDRLRWGLEEDSAITYDNWLGKIPRWNFDCFFEKEREQIQPFDVMRVARTNLNPEAPPHYPYGKEYLEHSDNLQYIVEGTLGRFPHLEALVCDHYCPNGTTDQSHWTFLFSTLAVASSRHIKELHLFNQDPSSWLARLSHLVECAPDLEELRSLTLGFDMKNRRIPRTYDETAAALEKLNMRLLDTLVISNQTDNESYLHINFTLFNFFPSEQHWKHLKTLHLLGIVASYPHLLSVLSLHAPTLRSLDLRNIRLTTALRDPANPLSWFNLFIFLHDKMKLSEFTISGKLEAVDGGWKPSRAKAEAGYCEFWDVSPKISGKPLHGDDGHTDCIKVKIEDYVTHKSAFPFMPRNGEKEKWETCWGPPVSWLSRVPWKCVANMCFEWDRAAYKKVRSRQN